MLTVLRERHKVQSGQPALCYKSMQLKVDKTQQTKNMRGSECLGSKLGPAAYWLHHPGQFTWPA